MVTSQQNTILVFGGSGFIGKVLLFQIMAQTNATIYVLLRPKRGKTAAQRLDELAKLSCFEAVREAFENGLTL